MKRYLALLSIITLTAIAAGCASAPSWLVSKTPAVARPAVTNVVQVLKTNFVGVTTYLTNVVTVQAATTNAATGEIVPAVLQRQLSPITQSVPVVSTNFETVVVPAATYTQYGPASTATGVIQMAGNLAPFPWAETASGAVLGLAGWVFGLINQRNAKKAAGEKQDALDTAKTVIANFDTLRATAKTLPQYTPEIDKRVMGVVKVAQSLMDVTDQVKELLAEHRTQTGGTPSLAPA